MTHAVVVDDVTKVYRVRRSGVRTLQEAVVGGFRNRGRAIETVALDRVSFTVDAGTTTGIVGPNGAGKSTLLRLIGRVGRPDRGRISVDGRVAALELGGGLHPELTGREATMLAGVVAGLTRREVRARFDDIVEFAGLGAFMDQPLRTFSSGMQMRLAFAIATHTDPEILLVDEVLAVGDLAFQRRCIDRLRGFADAGVTVVLVSHDHRVVADLCDRVVWLRGGRVAAIGTPRDIVARYTDSVARDTASTTPTSGEEVTADGTRLSLRENRFGTQAGRVRGVVVGDGLGARTDAVRPGDALEVSFEAVLPPTVVEPVAAVSIVRADGLLCADSSTVLRDEGAGVVDASVRFDRLDLAPGQYRITVALYGTGWSPTLDYHDRCYGFTVVGGTTAAALVPPNEWMQVSRRGGPAAPATPAGQPRWAASRSSR